MHFSVSCRQIEALTVDVLSAPITASRLAEVKTSLEGVPPVRFDLARQVRVFEPYLQYVELSLSGAAIQRHRMAIPTSIQKLGGSKDLEIRLRTTFELIEKGRKLSSKPLEDALNEIRKNFTPSWRRIKRRWSQSKMHFPMSIGRRPIANSELLGRASYRIQ